MFELWGGGGAPFTAHDGGDYLTDRKKTKVRLLAESRQVLEMLIATPEYWAGQLTLALASTCDEPEWAREWLARSTLR